MLIALAGLCLAAAKTYTVTLFQNATVAGTELKPGSYRMELNDQTLVIRNGKQNVSTPVKVENEAGKFASTSVRYNVVDGKYQIQEIRLGGTSMKLVLNN